MFVNNSKGNFNKDSDWTLQQYLDLVGDFKSSFSPMSIKEYEHEGKVFNVVDESIIECGFKARAAEFAVANTEEDELVYVQPRRGYAGISLSYLCEKYGKKLTLIMPSSKEISDHQALCIQYGANVKFLRIAAMPNANKAAKEYAESVGAKFFPLGLQDRIVTAGAVAEIYKNLGHLDIENMWSVISTGVLTRALQIALPDTKFNAIAVARNIKHGELGRAGFTSYHKPFNSKADYLQQSINIEDSYDAKGFEVMIKNGSSGDYFFSVAGNAPKPVLDKSTIDSYRDWRDKRDFLNL